MIKIINAFKIEKIELLLYFFPNNSQVFIKLNYDIKFLNHKSREIVTIVDNSTLIHKSVIQFNSLLLNSFCFKKPYALIGHCYTLDTYRGKGIYPAVINYLAKKYSSQNTIYMLVSPQNQSSIKGIEKAGYQFLCKLKCNRFLFLAYNKTISMLKQK